MLLVISHKNNSFRLLASINLVFIHIALPGFTAQQEGNMNQMPAQGNHIMSSKAADSRSKEVIIPLCLVLVRVVLDTNKQERISRESLLQSGAAAPSL